MYQDRFSFKKSSTVKDLKKLYERLERNFSYDCDAEEDVSKYRTKSPVEFSQTKTGVCWDYAEYEAKELEKLGFKNTLDDLTNGTYSLYYHEIDDHKQCPTHTWVACMIDDTVYVVESSWYDNRGVHHYATESDMIKSYCHKLCNGFKAPIQHLLIKYRPSPKFGLNCIEYMNRIHDNGRIREREPIHETFGAYEESNDVFSFGNKKSMISKFQDMKIIYDKLSSKEKSYLGPKFIDSPNTVYRQVVYANDNLPIGFVELYDMHNKPEVIIEAAVSPEYRNQGIAIDLINSAKHWFDKHHKYKRIVYLIKNGNSPSIKLAKKAGFVYLTKERDHMVYVYNRTNDSIDESLKFHF